MICFVILHYNTMEETEKCIASITEMEEWENIRIVIVDNASPNHTGKILAEKYNGNEKIDVILRQDNDGFSAGNNAGCDHAVKKWDPDFLVVANNDIEFCQKDFAGFIRKEYERTSFAVMGPDIYNPVKKIHQSPIADMPPNRKRVNRTIFLNRLMLGIFPMVYPVMKTYFRRMETGGNAKAYQRYQENVCLMGACLIYSREYLKKRAKIFDPETKFYYEENIQALWCAHNGKKVIYQPGLKVWHMEGSATKTIAAEKERIRFRMQNILESAKIYRDYLWETEHEEKVSAD